MAFAERTGLTTAAVAVADRDLDIETGTMPMTLQSIEEKLASASALDGDDVQAVWQSPDLVSIGMLGDAARRARHGTTTTFVRVADVAASQLDSFEIPAHAGEVRVVGTPADVFADVDALSRLVERAGNVPVSVGSLEEFESSAASASALRDRLRTVRDAGVYAVASAAVDRLGSPHASVGAVIDAGLQVARFTVGSPVRDPWALLEEVARLHAASKAVIAFAPIPFGPDPAQPTTGYSDVKLVALARIVLGAVDHIQVDWTRCGAKLAQVSLLFGADDVDAVSPLEETGTGARRAPLEELRRNVLAAALTPVERDGRFGTR